jgi:hypothetical protein
VYVCTTQVCVHTHTHVLHCTKVHKQLMALTKFSTYLVHVPLVAAAVGVGAYHSAHRIRRLDRLVQQFWPVRIGIKSVCRSSQFARQVNWLEISSWHARTDLRSVLDLQEFTWDQFLTWDQFSWPARTDLRSVLDMQELTWDQFTWPARTDLRSVLDI